MELTMDTAAWHVPDGTPNEQALGRVTHLGIGAHQDDLEFMAFHGILACHRRTDRWFGGVTCTNGAGSARTGPFASYTDQAMQAVRRQEQNAAADLGQYGVMIQLDFPSRRIRDPANHDLEADLAAILEAAQPEVVYTHNPADKHDTHVAVVAATLRALRALPPGQRPRQVLGCEVWRGLDWLMDDDKVVLDVSGHDELAQAMNGVFASQIAGGKRYDLATLGRRHANATFLESHGVDAADQVIYAMDLTPLLRNPSADAGAFVQDRIDRFAEDVRAKLAHHTLT